VLTSNSERNVKPVAIFRFSPTEGPGYLAAFLDRHGIKWQLHAIDEGADVPVSALGCSGIALMGGPMSVNDRLPWMGPMLALVRDAVACGVPVVGHCLGGQLLAKALGAQVTRAAEPEIGWAEVTLTDNPLAQSWFGEPDHFLSFHWHGETFRVPEGATRLAGSALCANQAYALGKHIGMQCHVEMTRELIESWIAHGAQDFATFHGPGVQSPDEIKRDIERRVEALTARAEHVYTRWIDGLVRE
jgi:GMP synthase-like glutamine amidotransferase